MHRPHLIAAEHRDHALVHGMIGQDVDRQVHAGARAVAANRGRADHHAGEVIRLVLPQHRFAHALEFVVERQRNEGMILGDVRRVADAVHRAHLIVRVPRRAADSKPHKAAAIIGGAAAL